MVPLMRLEEHLSTFTMDLELPNLKKQSLNTRLAKRTPVDLNAHQHQTTTDVRIQISPHQKDAISSARTGEDCLCSGTGEHAFLELGTAHWGCQG